MTAHHCHDCGHDFADDLTATTAPDAMPAEDDDQPPDDWAPVDLERAARHVRALMPPRPRRARCPHCGSTNTEVRT